MMSILVVMIVCWVVIDCIGGGFEDGLDLCWLECFCNLVCVGGGLDND